ncbi:MAG: hypothetical protein ACM3SP_12445 [Chloroflexota bacterium]
MNLGPTKLLDLNAMYLERRSDSASPGAPSIPPTGNLGGYFDLYATSSHFAGKMIGESEFAYSTLGLSPFSEQHPVMTRVSARGEWDKSAYGVAFKSFGGGFVPLIGAKVENPRDESQFWAEYDFGLFRFKGTAGATRESNPATSQVTITKTTGASFSLAKPNWNASLSSSYSLIGQADAADQGSAAFANIFSVSYRPASYFTIEPNWGFKREWDLTDGLASDTPSGGLALSWTPVQDLQLTGRASYLKNLSIDPLKEPIAVHAGAALAWKVGKSFLGDQSLSFQVEYKDQIHATPSIEAAANLTASIQFKVAGF